MDEMNTEKYTRKQEENVGKKINITDRDNISGTHGKIVIGRRREKTQRETSRKILKAENKIMNRYS